MRDALDPSVVRSVYDRAARHYDRLHGLLTLRSDRRGRQLVVRGATTEGDCVLDAGGGTGSTALLAAERVGARGRIVVLDASEGMLEVARQRARSAGMLERMELLGGDILHLPFEDGAFDSVLSTYSVDPLVDPAAGVLELYRVTRRGGRLGIAHRTMPRNAGARWLADRVEDVVWRFPSLTLGCRAVTTLPTLRQHGAEVLLERTFGVPLWPFLAYVARKPD